MRLAKLLLILLSVVPALAQAPADGRFDSAAERELVRLLNQARADAGLPALAVDDRLTQAARQHSLLMAEKGALSHQFPGEPPTVQRLVATGIRFNAEGENVAFDSGAAADAHAGLMNSPPHRENILSPKYNAVGVGVVRKGELLYVTEDFAHRLEEYSPTQAENAAAEAFAALRKRATARAASRVPLPMLRNLACTMAKQDQPNARGAAGSLPQARYVIAYTQSEPQMLPANAVQLSSNPDIKEFAVGACYATTERYPSGTWWFVMAFF